MNTIYKEDYSKNKFLDKAHPFKSAIIFIQTSLAKNLIFFNDEKEKKDFIDFFEKQFIKALYESFEQEENKFNDLVYNINFNHFDNIEKFLLKLKLHKENIWIYQIMILIIFHQSLPNNNPQLHGRHINEPLLDEKYVKELFDIHLLELMRIILIYDSSSHCLLSTSKWEQEIDKYFDLLIKNNYLSSEKEEKEEIKENNIVYLAELDGDIDDVIAAEYLYNNYALKCIVCDPIPSTKIGKTRVNNLKKLDIEIYYKMPEDTDIVFCGGPLTVLSQFIENHKISTLVMNGGFVGDNIVPKNDVLKKFEGKKTMRTFNVNCDVESTDKVLKSSTDKIGKIILVGKNVCHSKKNTTEDIWNSKEYDYLFSKYKVRKEKCLHDLLMCHEGLCLLNLLNEELYCKFEEVYPFGEYGKQWEDKLQKMIDESYPEVRRDLLKQIIQTDCIQIRLNFSYGSKIVGANGFSTGEIRQFVNIYTSETEYKTIQIPLGRIMVEKNQGLMFVPQESFDNSIIWL